MFWTLPVRARSCRRSYVGARLSANFRGHRSSLASAWLDRFASSASRDPVVGRPCSVSTRCDVVGLGCPARNTCAGLRTWRHSAGGLGKKADTDISFFRTNRIWGSYTSLPDEIVNTQVAVGTARAGCGPMTNSNLATTKRKKIIVDS